MPTRYKRYPYDEWFSRRGFILHRGIDYHISTSSMIQQVRNEASTRKVNIRVVEEDYGFSVFIIPHQVKSQPRHSLVINNRRVV